MIQQQIVEGLHNTRIIINNRKVALCSLQKEVSRADCKHLLQTSENPDTACVILNLDGLTDGAINYLMIPTIEEMYKNLAARRSFLFVVAPQDSILPKLFRKFHPSSEFRYVFCFRTAKIVLDILRLPNISPFPEGVQRVKKIKDLAPEFYSYLQEVQETLRKKYRFTRLLGIGGFNVALEAQNKTSRKKVVIKLHYNNSLQGSIDAIKEATLLKNHYANNHYVIDCYEFGIKTTKTGRSFLYQVQEKGGESLGEWSMKKARELAANPQRRLAILLELLKQMREVCIMIYVFLKQNAVHRDIKAANIVVTDDGGCKIIDLGLSKAVIDDEKTAYPVGTLRYIPEDELLEPHKYSSTELYRDLYALGCTLFTIYTGKKPFFHVDDSLSSLPYLIKEKQKQRWEPEEFTQERPAEEIEFLNQIKNLIDTKNRYKKPKDLMVHCLLTLEQEVDRIQEKLI